MSRLQSNSTVGVATGNSLAATELPKLGRRELSHSKWIVVDPPDDLPSFFVTTDIAMVGLPMRLETGPSLLEFMATDGAFTGPWAKSDDTSPAIAANFFDCDIEKCVTTGVSAEVCSARAGAWFLAFHSLWADSRPILLWSGEEVGADRICD